MTKTVIFDFGSSTSRIGSDENETPKKFPTLVGRSTKPSDEPGMGPNDFYVGHHCYSRRALYEDRNDFLCECPIKNGMIENWDQMEKLIDYSCKAVARKPEESNFVMTEAVLNMRNKRSKMVENIFEKFNAPGLFFGSPAFFGLVAYGLMETSIVVDIGHEMIQVLPYSKEGERERKVGRLEYGGKDISEYYKHLLNGKGNQFKDTLEDSVLIDDLKQKSCYVAESFRKEMNKENGEVEKEYELVDGRKITVGKERFKVAEALFDPSIIGKTESGFQHMVYNSIMRFDMDTRKKMCEKILLIGGASKMDGIKERAEKEIGLLFPPSMKIKVHGGDENADIASWIGASIVSRLSTFDKLIGTRQQYEELGVNYFLQRFN